MTIKQLLSNHRIIPVVTIEDPHEACALAKALFEGGIHIIEVTLRTSSALDAIRAIRAELPEMIVAAGTVLTPEQLQSVDSLKVNFAVSPGFTHQLLEASRHLSLPFLPGASTLSEMMYLREYGFDTIKFFPAELVGGINFLTQLSSLIPDLQFCPTGGINETNYQQYLALPNVIGIGSSWITPKEWIATKQWKRITARCQIMCTSQKNK